jgi:hypothetical protein
MKNMTGLLKHNGKQWVVYNVIEDVEYPLYYKDSEFVDSAFQPTFSKDVEFDLVDEFTHGNLFRDVAWGEGSQCAKLKNKK